MTRKRNAGEGSIFQRKMGVGAVKSTSATATASADGVSSMARLLGRSERP